jgi:hypothetical protein
MLWTVYIRIDYNIPYMIFKCVCAITHCNWIARDGFSAVVTLGSAVAEESWQLPGGEVVKDDNSLVFSLVVCFVGAANVHHLLQQHA